jgi:ABC-2 type transport system ATP-binding protein
MATHADTQDAAISRGDARAVVACQRLTKVFKDFWMRDRARAVDALDLTIHQREIFGLLGPNGSGKSTTIKMILGLLRPTSGRIAVFGRPPSDVATKRRIGYLPEESYLYPFLNARETLDYYGKLFELDHRTRQRRTDELLDMVGLTGAQFRPVREYSKGMQRRIGIAQALINDPELLILDEPTTGLDPIGTRQVKDLILELGRRGKTVILSSHLLADVEDCVDRMVILYGGKIRREGSCNELLARHDRTTIETDGLDVETITAIDELVRQRTGGAKSIVRVASPRQKLEELFVGIVEEARNERLATSGAQHGGQTAAFLRGEEQAEGDALIDKLVSSEPEPAAVREPTRPAGRGEDGGTARDDADDLLARLTTDTAEPAPAPAPARPGPARPEAGQRGADASRPPQDSGRASDADEDMIRRLMGGDGGGTP